jgi:protein ImuB
MKRILCLWFLRLAAERMIRAQGGAVFGPFGVISSPATGQVLVSINQYSEQVGLRLGQPLRDATALCPALITKTTDPLRDAMFLQALQRWAGKFSPWVAPEGVAGLLIDLTGCAHLFGGELPLMQAALTDCTALGLSVRVGLADTPGLAWALARNAGQGTDAHCNSGHIAQVVRPTKLRSLKRRNWERGGVAPISTLVAALDLNAVAPVGQSRAALSPLPIAALRLPDDIVTGLARLGLRQISELLGLPRAGLAKRFGVPVLRRLDQALGLEPEPISSGRPPQHFAVRLTFPDPIGLPADIVAGAERLLPALCAQLQAKGQGARRLRLEAFRTDGQVPMVEVGLAQAVQDADSIRPLLALKYDQIDSGFGIDCLRLSVVKSESVTALQHSGHVTAAQNAVLRQSQDRSLDDLIGKLGAKLGSDCITRMHPAQSHIPEKSVLIVSAAWSNPAPSPWLRPVAPRPLLIFRPETVGAADQPEMPAQFRWRRCDFSVRQAIGPERIAPEWWLDDPEWRSGPRDYWRVEVVSAERLWLFYAHGGLTSSGWFCHGKFA